MPHPPSTHKKIRKRLSAKKAELISSGAAITAAAASTASITTLVAERQLRPFDKNLWNPAFSQRDVPLNKMPIIIAHNSGTEAGSGTMFFNQNQTLSPYELLAQTPARGLEFQVENDKGTLITNHGAALSSSLINHSASNPETLASQLNSVKQWLSEPENKDQLIILQISNQASTNQDAKDIHDQLVNTFGNSLFTQSDLLLKPGTWPTINEITKKGKQVLVLASGMGNHYGNEIIPSSWTVQSFLNPHPSCPDGMVWLDTGGGGEDRTLVGNLVGHEMTAGLPSDQQFVGSLNTEQVDQIIQKGGMIKLDQIAPNDPRLVAPELRAQLALDPNVSLFGGLLQVDRGLVSALTFGAGVLADTGAGAFALADIAYRAYQNAVFIQDAGKHFKAALAKADLVDLVEFKRSRDKQATQYQDYHKLVQATAEDLNAKDLADYCRRQLQDKLTGDTVKAGLLGTTALAGSVFSAGLLFPVAFPITSLLALVIGGAGLIGTGLATYLNKRALTNKLKEIYPGLSFHVGAKTLALKRESAHKEKSHFGKKAKSKRKDSWVSAIGEFFLGGTLLLRIGSMAKYAVALVGTIASGSVALMMYLRSAFDAAVNYRNRQKNRKNIPKLVSQAALPNIDGKRFILFGESPLEKFIGGSQKQLIAQYDLPKGWSKLSAREMLTRLEGEDSLDAYLDIRKTVISGLIEKDLKQYCQSTHQLYQAGNEELIKKYLLNKVDHYIRSDVRASGRINYFKIGLATWIGGSFLAPPLAGFFAAIAVGALIVGEIVTQSAAFAEVRRFRKATKAVLDETKATNPSPAAAELSSFISLIQTELLKGANHSPKTAPRSNLASKEENGDAVHHRKTREKTKFTHAKLLGGFHHKKPPTPTHEEQHPKSTHKRTVPHKKHPT